MQNLSFPHAKNLVIAAAALLVVAILWFGPFFLPETVLLEVPYTSQVFNGNWVAPWDEACEEASITMIDYYYAGTREIPPGEGMANMEEMFTWEDAEFGMNHDTDAAQTKRLIESQSDFSAFIKRNPTVKDIKSELARKRPVIALVHMFTLYDERDLGDSYHVLVVIGYDDTKREFTVHDPGRNASARYPYDRLMNALHDFDPQTKEANGTPTVLFTRP